MANTYTSLHYHIIFSTKLRERWIPPEIEQRIWSYLGGIANENKMTPLKIGGVEDHVHLVLGVHPTVAISQALKLLKTGSSGWVHNTFPGMKGFGWQDGYAAFAVSKSLLPEVIAYVEGQREHHKTRTFQEEYLAFLRKHEIDYDERYVFD
ncbi:MAG TPA: IS200/IS605 family transposase [Verrucomicrobiae bacterium]